MSSTPLSPTRSSVLIVSPALADANNGNWHTASRWVRMLRNHCRIGLAQHWDGKPCDLLIALHARRSAPSIDAWAQAHPGRPLVVVLTGTDLYRDIRVDASAQRSLQQATHLVVLQEQGALELEPALRAKCSVIYQSAPKLAAVDPPRRVLRVVNVGHLRDEKDPETFMRAAMRLAHRRDLRFEQIGAALDARFEAAAQRTAAACPSYRWLGALAPAATRQRIRRAHLLANCSVMEGGAQVVIEAACSGTAVLASRIPGHAGLLGAAHAGWFEVGDDAGLARLVERAADAPEFLTRLRAQTVARAPLFEPAEEAARLIHLVRSALTSRKP